MSECLPFKGYLNNGGYGITHINGRTIPVMRLIAAISYGLEYNSNKVVMHKCDRRDCINVEHLEVGTQADNIRDCVLKGRASGGGKDKTHCKNGHEYTPQNTYWRKRKRSHGNIITTRDCMACRNYRNSISSNKRKYA